MSDLREKADALLLDRRYLSTVFINWIEAVTAALESPEAKGEAVKEVDYSGYHFASCEQSAPAAPAPITSLVLDGAAANARARKLQEDLDTPAPTEDTGMPTNAYYVPYPIAIKESIRVLCIHGHHDLALDLEGTWRSQPPPPKVAMTPQIIEDLNWILAIGYEKAASAEGNSIAIVPTNYASMVRSACDRVRFWAIENRSQLSAQPGTGRPEKVRALIEFARANAQYLTDSLTEGAQVYVRDMMHERLDDAQSELDAFEKGASS